MQKNEIEICKDVNSITNQVKLVVWDLDDTFWKGTLAEEKVYLNEENIEMIRILTDRGIMNSIVSKNDYSKAMKVLREAGIDDLFVFPVINYEPKGQQVKTLLETMGIRAENTVFIDDNDRNLYEVKYLIPEIIVMAPYGGMQKDIIISNNFRGKDDKKHERLKQYHDLEKRRLAKTVSSSNEEFLYDSEIEVCIMDNCMDEIERIHELVIRTNQLNYTKKRVDINKLKETLQDKGNKTGYVRVSDKYGDYGIVGFFAVNKNGAIEHFLFSCRALNIGLENYIYNKIGRPYIEIVGEVATPLDNRETPWIKESMSGYVSSDSLETKKTKLLMVGGCDLEQSCKYIESRYAIRKELATVIGNQIIKTSDTSQLLNTLHLPDNIKEELCNLLPWYDKNITFSTKMFDGENKIVVYSVVDDYIRGIYRRKKDDWFIGYGAYWEREQEIQKLNTKSREYLEKYYEWVGKEPIDVFRKNLNEIVYELKKRKVKLILINGIDLDVSEWIGKDRCIRNSEMNAVVDEIVNNNPDVYLLDMRKIVTNKQQLVVMDNRHYDRYTYYTMAQELIRLMNDIGTQVSSKSYLRVWTRDQMVRVKNKLYRMFRQKG